MDAVEHPALRPFLRPRYREEEVRALHEFLSAAGTLTFVPLPSGLYPAASLAPAESGYGSVWVRDNVQVAMAHAAAGENAVAATVLRGLATFLGTQRPKMEAIVEGRADPRAQEARPHVRFDGVRLAELPERWPHAQNDALGYFLWAYCRLAAEGHLVADGDLLSLLPLYFGSIRYWEDEDSGHWEEARKVEASSIGPVVAGLKALRALEAGRGEKRSQGSSAAALDDLILEGERALTAILPAECVQPGPHKARAHDAALLFLVEPLELVEGAMADRIVDGVIEHLMGDHGIRRYLGDSYWTADYREKFPPEVRTGDYSEQLEVRDALARPGEEAQWCLFDPVVSTIAGRRFRRTLDPAALERQVRHLHRALGQLTGPGGPYPELRCPEAYFLERGRYVPNDHVPLYWAQANLWTALRAMEESAGIAR